MIDLGSIRQRISRLEQLAKGLSREVACWEGGNDPLLFRERRPYLKGIQDALAGLESARVVLAQAKQRLEAESERYNQKRGA